MFSMPSILRWRRLVVLAWLIAWITIAPLFHIHIPDATDGWSALQSGGAHTVFTQDLPGEYSRPFHDSELGHSSHLSQRAVNSPELGIAIFDDPDDRKLKAVHVLGSPFHLSDASPQHSGVLTIGEPYRPLQPFQASSASRAPPRIAYA